MKVFFRIVLIPLIAGLVALPAAAVAAAGPETTQPVAAPASNGNEGIPATSVARLKIDKGTAWVRPADSGEWQEYGTNTPLAERSRVSVPNGSEARILFREGQSLLLRGGAEVEIRELGEKHVAFRLQSGAVALSLPKDGFAPLRFRVPGKREVDIGAPGTYSIAADGGVTKFVVSAGEGTVSGEGAKPVAVKAGEQASIGETIQVARAEATAAAPPASVAERPMTEAEREAGIPPEAAGELRDYGNWVDTPEYGSVWRPYVADDWTPYYYGHWAWVYPYGWVWVADEPWGWWPYHYGWWVDSPAFGWVWCPFHSFFSVDFFFFGHSRFFFHQAFFFGANVRFAFDRDGRFIRWTPARPGTTVTRAPFSRGDTRLAQWNQPLRRGDVMVRGEGGRLTAWEGRGGVGRTAMRGTDRATARSFSGGGGRVSAAVRAPAAMNSRGVGRGQAMGRGGGPSNVGAAGGSRGFDGLRGATAPRTSNGFGSFRGASPPSRGFDRGGFRGSEGRSGSFGGGGFRGFEGGGFRGFGGGGGRMR